MADSTYIVYGSPLSYFSMKLVTAMQWTGLPFSFEPRGPAVTEELQQRSATHQIPILRTPEGWVLNDTTPLLRLLDGRLPAPLFYPAGVVGAVCAVIEEYFDEWIPRLAVYYRWMKPDSAAFAAPALAKHQNAVDVDATAKMIAGWGKRACRALGMTEPHMMQAGEAELERIYNILNEHLADHDFLFGHCPTAADAVIRGGLVAHFALDPAPRRLVQRYPRLLAWLDRPPRAFAHRGCSEAPLEISPSVHQLLQEMSRNQAWVDVTLANSEALQAKRKSFKLAVYGKEVSLLARAYPHKSLLMLRRFLKVHLADEQQQREFQGILSEHSNLRRLLTTQLTSKAKL